MDTTSRRTFFARIGAGLALAPRAGAGPSLTTLRNAPWRVDAADGSVAGLKLERAWSQEFCKPKLVNAGKRPVRVKQVAYGESFQMLSQTAGTLAKPVDLGYSEPKHYKIPQPEGVTALSGLLTLDGSLTFAFTSCHRFHATAVYATGGMTLSGDDLTKIPADRLAMLRKLLPPTGVAAEFEDDSLSVGIVKLPGRNMACLFNWGETPHALFFRPPEPSHIRDYWTGEDLGRHEGLLIHMAPHSAQLLECLPARPLDIHAFERERVLKAANRYLEEEPITVTASSSPRSAGGVHDFFSEGDYWWPDPKNPGGPYVQRDGMSNPDNFVDHRRYLMRLSVQTPALTAAWKLTHDARYARHAGRHLRAWFVDEATRMSPRLQYSQAIHGRATGRGTGVIDTIHLVEVARAVEALEGSPAFSKSEAAGIRGWFADYLRWMTTHPYGIEERDAKNNHGTCWVMQAAAFSRLTANREVTVRTKPYGYSLFNLDAMSTICQILSTPAENLWAFELPDGRGIRKAVAFMAPYIRDKSKWPKPPDVMYDQEWPMRQCSLLFAGLAFGNPDYLELWRTLKADSTVEEVIRNFFIRQPVLWVE